MYTIVKIEHDDGSDCTLAGRYSLDIVPVSEVKSPGFVGTYEECQFFLDESEQEERANEELCH